MTALKLPAFFQTFFTPQRVVFWFSSQELLISWQQHKHQFPLPAGSGFAAGQIADADTATTTIRRILNQEKIRSAAQSVFLTAVVFVTTASSPLEREVVRRVFQQAGFQKVNLVTYATALRTFAQRQAIRAGAGVYVGNDVSEALVFDKEEQEAFVLDYSRTSAQDHLTHYIRQEQQLEIASETAQKVYARLGKVDGGALVIRGRNVQTQQVETQSLSAAKLSELQTLFRQKIAHELKVLTASAVFQRVQPTRWVVVGDALLDTYIKETYQGETVFLSSELAMIQGVEWL